MVTSSNNHHTQKICVIIATALNRFDLLFQKSLPSVYHQFNVDAVNVEVIIVDDNVLDNSVAYLVDEVAKLRRTLGLNVKDFRTQVLKNQRTPNMSGTGAWNTGIYKAYEDFPTCFVAILDDDDAYLPNHLEQCLHVTKEAPHVEGVFQEIVWKNEKQEFWHFPLKVTDITPEAFYIGNPGIQGSNLFVKAHALIAINGFDESLSSATDRDLLLRLLWYWKAIENDYTSKFVIINEPGVIHYVHDLERITTNIEKKHSGLNTFYAKYKKHFTIREYYDSLKRANFIFQYEQHTSKEVIAIGMAMRNNADTVGKAIQSILQQKAPERDVFIIVSDDNSTDESFAKVSELSAMYPNVILEKGSFGNAAKNRNHIQKMVQERFPNCVLLGRLDADDELASDTILQQIETLYDETPFDVLFMANNQILKGDFTGYVNRPDEQLLASDYLLDQLHQMAQGNWEAELPSCNLFIHPAKAIPFEEIYSSEDHRNFVDYLLQAQHLKLVFQPEWIYANYSIDKHFDANHHRIAAKIQSREALYHYAKTEIEKRNRKTTALMVLKNKWSGDYTYLGAGFSGVVFHDEQWVYKVHIPLTTNNFNEIDNILFLKEKLHLFSNRKHFYPLRELTEIDGYYVLIYPYEVGEAVTSLEKEDMISFLAEMWQMKVICRSITKENNFMRYNGVIKLIDYEIESYSDNLFLNLAARAFIQLNDYKFQNVSYDKLKRSTINNFVLPELEGFYDFVEEIFQACVQNNFSAKEKVLSLVPSSSSSEKTQYDGKNHPKVNLLIKACVQDSEHLYHDVRFLVGQLTQSVSFHQRVLSLDLYKKNAFLRQYTQNGQEEQLLAQAQKLVEEGIIDSILIPPTAQEAIEQTNFNWFGILGNATHTEKGVPITSQIYAFQEMQADYILQLDVDILIGLKSATHDYLQPMIQALEHTPNAISHGFQIYQSDDEPIQAVFGFDGTIAPDVRCCLIAKERLVNALPLPNQHLELGWALSWYRALEQKQKENNLVALRGGENDSFYLHLQNYRKTNRWVWFTIQQAVKQGLLPQKQIGNPEIVGDIFDWCLPKRNEPLVVLFYVDTLDLKGFSQSFQTILNQDLSSMGIVVINNSDDFNGLEAFQSQCKANTAITWLNMETKVPYNEAIYKAIHYYLNQPDTFVSIIKQDDLLLYPAVLSECMNRLKTYGADVLVGKEISYRTLPNSGITVSNFIHPRTNPESLANGLQLFKKYLFDSLSHFDLKSKHLNAPKHIANFSKIKETHQWIDDESGISFMVPMVEMSSNPIRFDHYNVLRKTPTSGERLAEAIAFVQTKTPKVEGSWQKGRKTFLPNQHKIELDITYDCNLKCFHCNRSCTQAPTQSHMTLEQIKTFVEESIALGKKWQLINVLGGEPTIHPEFAAIIDCLLYEYVIPFSPETTLQVTSNGFGEEVREKLAALPQHANLTVNSNSFKDDKEVPYFTPFNMAPKDEEDAATHEYKKGCWVTSYCGIGLNHLGYFACGVAGGIDRVLQSNKGIKRLQDVEVALLQEQLQEFCQWCGNFSTYAGNNGDFMERAEKDTAPKKAMSSSWKEVYKQNNKHESI